MKTSPRVKHPRLKSVSLLIALVQMGFALAVPRLLRAQTWETPPTPQPAGGSIACSQDGRSLFTTVGDGFKYLYESTNAGDSWTNPISHFIGPVACSGDGAKVAVPIGSSVLISTNKGQSFVTNYTGGNAFYAVWSQAGNMLALLNTESVWLTTNLGATWTKPPAMQSNDWEFLAISGDGRTIVAAVQSYAIGLLRISTNSGVSWADAAVTNRYFGPVACTADGSRIYGVVADVNTGLIMSEDFGRTWSYANIAVVPEGERGIILSLACSEDGSLVAGKLESYSQSGAMISRNFGASWIMDPPNNGISEVTCSADGTLLMGSADQIILQYLAPPLYVASSGVQLTLSWPAPSSQYTLQQISDLGSTNWLAVTNAITVTNYRNQVTLPAPAHGNVFYRLNGPGS